jgi:hypothetical protein
MVLPESAQKYPLSFLKKAANPIEKFPAFAGANAILQNTDYLEELW